MKKKCRVYKPQSMQQGGETQDSQLGNVPETKASNFVNWLKGTSELAQFEKEMTNYQYGGSPNGYGELETMNMGAYQDAYQDMEYNPMNDIQTLGSLVAPMFAPKKEEQYSDEYMNQNYSLKPKKTNSTFGAQPGGFGQGMNKGFQLGKAQTGKEVSYPDYGMGFMPEIDNSDYLPNGGLDFMAETDNSGIRLQDIYATEQDYNSGQTGQLDESTYTNGPDMQKNKVKNPYALTQGVLAGARLLTGFGEMDERAALEAQINKKFGNVHENYGTMGADRGDYMANVPGVGDPLKPNQHTRMGYNTKIAQNGIEIQDNTYVKPFPRINEQVYPFGPEDFEAINNYVKNNVDKDKRHYGITNETQIRNRAMENLQNNQNLWIPDYKDQFYQMQGLPEYEKPIGIKQQGGEYNIDQELELTEEQINDLIAQGYNLEYLD